MTVARVALGVFIAAGLVVAARARVLREPPRRAASPTASTGSPSTRASPTTRSRHALADAPTAGYGVDGVDDERLGTGLAGLIGVVVTFAVVRRPVPAWCAATGTPRQPPPAVAG